MEVQKQILPVGFVLTDVTYCNAKKKKKVKNLSSSCCDNSFLLNQWPLYVILYDFLNGTVKTNSGVEQSEAVGRRTPFSSTHFYLSLDQLTCMYHVL